MFSEEVVARYFTDTEIRKMPIDVQSTALHTMERILEEEERRNSNATRNKSELF